MNVVKAQETAHALVELGDHNYPPLLTEIHDPPKHLYVKGDRACLQRPMLAVVGSRRASPAALRLAQGLCAELARAGLAICSGLALGVDGAAHRGALAAAGKTVAVMATGIDRVYPRRHRALADEVINSGCLVTEFAPGSQPLKHHFPRRNRIISGMSLGVLVVEAALPSGSLITARSALEQGREVFALPWSPLHERGRGCLHLLRDGARMVETAADVLEELGPMYAALQDRLPRSPPREAGSDSALLQLVGYEAVSLDELALRSGAATADIMAELSALELAGLLARVPGGYIRCQGPPLPSSSQSDRFRAFSGEEFLLPT